MNAHYKHVPKEEKICNSARLDIPTDNEYRQCNLTIFSFRIEDVGQWQCVVRDWNLKREDSHVFNLAKAGSNSLVQQQNFAESSKLDRFFIESFSPEEVAFKEVGEWITLSCKVNDHFDVCEWTHQAGSLFLTTNVFTKLF